MTVVDARVRKGSLTLGGDPFSCQPTNVTIAPDHEGTEEDSVEVLCGDVLAGTTANVLTANLTMTSIQDFTDPDGLQAFSWANDGVATPFAWNPTDDPDDEWTGDVIPESLTVGGDVAARITADAEWKITKLVTPPRFGSKTVIGGTTAATGATAGSPGAWTPSGSTPPANLAALTGASPAIVASPATAWSTGQSVVLGDASHAYWNGTAWTNGTAP